MAKTYCRVAGVLLLVLGVLGILKFHIGEFLTISEPAEIVIHLVSGAIAAYAGFKAGYSSAAMTYARVFGVIYLAVAVVGFIWAHQTIIFGIHLDTGCNLAHLLLGVWGVWVGYFTKQEMAMAGR